METKTCTKCGECKPLDKFYFRSNGKPLSKCKQCYAEAARQWRANNLEKARANEAKWRANNPEKARTRSVGWRARNIEKARASEAKWRANNPEKERAKSGGWRARNIEKARAGRVKQRVELSQSYVAKLLNLPVSQLTPELLEAKREHLRNIRITKQLISTLKELSNGK